MSKFCSNDGTEMRAVTAKSVSPPATPVAPRPVTLPSASSPPPPPQVPPASRPASQSFAGKGLLALGIVLLLSSIAPVPLTQSYTATETYTDTHTGYRDVTTTLYPNYYYDYDLGASGCYPGGVAPGSMAACVKLFNTGEVSGRFTVNFYFKDSASGARLTCSGSEFVQVNSWQYVGCVLQKPSWWSNSHTYGVESVETPPPQTVTTQEPYTYTETHTRQVPAVRTSWAPLIAGVPLLGILVLAAGGVLIMVSK